MATKLFYSICYGILIAYSLGVFWLNVGTKKLDFLTIRGGLRRAVYILALVELGAGYALGYIWDDNYKTWAVIFVLAVIIDLTIILTPNISKLWNAEFNYVETYEETIRDYRKGIFLLKNRAENIAEVLTEFLMNFSIPEEIDGWEPYSKALKNFLLNYAKGFDFHLSLWQYDHKEIDTMRMALLRIRQTYGIDLPDRRLNKVLSDFNNEIANRLDEIVIIPFKGKKFKMLIVIEKVEGQVLEQDILNLGVLARLFERLVYSK